MKWSLERSGVLASDTLPAYKIARFVLPDGDRYRASFKGEFIGQPLANKRAARDLCERHHQITQEAKELPHAHPVPA